MLQFMLLAGVPVSPQADLNATLITLIGMGTTILGGFIANRVVKRRRKARVKKATVNARIK